MSYAAKATDVATRIHAGVAATYPDARIYVGTESVQQVLPARAFVVSSLCSGTERPPRMAVWEVSAEGATVCLRRNLCPWI
jgi:hypothetical protein